MYHILYIFNFIIILIIYAKIILNKRKNHELVMTFLRKIHSINHSLILIIILILKVIE